MVFRLMQRPLLFYKIIKYVILSYQLQLMLTARKTVSQQVRFVERKVVGQHAVPPIFCTVNVEKFKQLFRSKFLSANNTLGSYLACPAPKIKLTVYLS